MSLPTPQRESEASGELDPHVIARYVRNLLDANGWNLSQLLGALRAGGSRSGDAARSRQPERVGTAAWDYAAQRLQQDAETPDRDKR